MSISSTHTGIQQRNTEEKALSRASFVMTGVITDSSLSARNTIRRGFLCAKYMGRLKGVNSP